MSRNDARVRVRGLYALTPDTDDTEALVGKVSAALEGGVTLVQYRNKGADRALRLAQARALVALCAARGATLIVNDHVDIALEAGAHGVHLGGEDGSVAAARAALGPARLLGVSCYASIERARAAEREGADHVAFGSFFPSPTKPGAVRAPLALLGEAKRAVALPIVAIGGITAENGAALVAAGGDALAVISALFDAPDIVSAASRFNSVFDPVS